MERQVCIMGAEHTPETGSWCMKGRFEVAYICCHIDACNAGENVPQE